MYCKCLLLLFFNSILCFYSTDEDNPGKRTHPPQMRDLALCWDFRRNCEVSASARGVYDVLKASLRLHCLSFLLKTHCWIGCADLFVCRR